MTIDYSRFDAIRIDTSSSESSSPKSSSTSPLGKRISDEEAKVLRTTFDAKRVPCTTHRRTNNLLLLLTDRAESVNALAGYTKAFNLPQTETWVVPLLPRVLLNEEISSSSSSDLEDDDDDDDDIDDLKNANNNNINDFSRRKRRRRLRRVVCDIALVAADALDFDLETQIHFLACGREASLAAMEACAIFGELFEGAGGAFMITDVDEKTCVDTGRCISFTSAMALKTFGGGFVRTIERRNKRREDVPRRKTRMTFLQYSTAASKNKLKDASTSLDNPEFFRRNYFETFHHESARTPLESEKENCLIANETEARILFSHLGKTLKETPDDPDVVDLTRRPREEKSYAYDFDVSSHPRRKLVAKIGDLNDVFEAMFVRRVGVSQKARSATKD